MSPTRLLLLSPLLLLLVACGGGPDAPGSSAAMSSTASGEGSRSEVAPAPAANAPGATGATGAAHGADPVASTAVLQRAVISQGSLEMQTTHVADARLRVLDLVRGWDGLVADEQSVTSSSGTMTSSDLDLRVPSSDFDEAMAALPKVARTLHTDRSSQDVTTQVLDTGARVRAQETSIRRIESLLAQAKNLGQIISIESDLANRQATLDSLKSQQAYLADQTSLASVHVTITRPAHAGPPAQHHRATGLLAGLDTGFTALRSVTVGALTVLGVLAPFILVLTLVGVPVLLGWRRRRTSAAPAAPSQT